MNLGWEAHACRRLGPAPLLTQVQVVRKFLSDNGVILVGKLTKDPDSLLLKRATFAE